MAQNYYQILGLSPKASIDEIKVAFRNMAKIYHPDKGGKNEAFHEEKFKQINEAYQILSDPQKKALYDLKLITYPKYRARRVRYSQRTRRYYTNRPTNFSKKAYMYAFFFVLGLISIVGYSTFFLINHQSTKAYEEGISLYEQGHYDYAIMQLTRATRDFGGSSVPASILATKILLYDLQYYNKALIFIELGLKRAETQEHKAQLYYYKANYYKFQEYYDKAYMAYQTTVTIDPKFDSAYYQMGELDAFVFKRYENAIEHFDSLMVINPAQYEGFIGRGFCKQKLGQDSSAILDFEEYIKFNSNEGMAFYLKAVSELNLKDTARACSDLSYANILGVENSKELMKRVCRE